MKQQEKENEQKLKQNEQTLQTYRASELTRGNQSAQQICPQKENNIRDFNLVDFSFDVASLYISGHTSTVCLFLDRRVELLFYYSKNYNHGHFGQCYILDY